MRYLLIVCTTLFITACSPSVYEVTGVDTITREHQSIAILAPKVDYLFEDTSKKRWSRVPSKDSIAHGFQLALTDWVVAQLPPGGPDITLIDLETSRELLSGATPTDYSQLGSELGVDVVMVSRLKYDTRPHHQLRFELTAVVTELLTSKVYLNLYTPQEGLIWSYRHQHHRYPPDFDFMVYELVRRATETFPYTTAK